MFWQSKYMNKKYKGMERGNGKNKFIDVAQRSPQIFWPKGKHLAETLILQLFFYKKRMVFNGLFAYSVVATLTY